MAKSLLSILVRLAKVDGEIVPEEYALIYHIGQAHGMNEAEIRSVIDSPEKTINVAILSDDDRFEYLYTLVELMKADEKLYLEEIKFCSKVAAKLGYDEAVMYDLITEVYSDYQQYDKSWQKQKVQEYLRK
jgi:uncharacterized tellurite resistance protein B-like protein